MTRLFLHGLDSSGKGTKGTYLSHQFPDILCPDFFGTLEERLAQLAVLCEKLSDLILVGSSFGGLMATCHALRHPHSVNRLILLAPALNFADYSPPQQPISIPALLVIGNSDDVCPPDLVLPLAKQTFANLETEVVSDDHMLHNSFQHLNWESLLLPY